MEFFLSLTPRIAKCVSEYIFFVSKEKTNKKHTYKQKAKETKENRQMKETKEEKEKKMLLLTISVKNLPRYDDIV